MLLLLPFAVLLGCTEGVPTAAIIDEIIASVDLAPSSATIGVGQTQQFSAMGRRAGEPVAVPVSFVAEGGTINGSGLFTAGTTTGTFRVIASHSPTGGTPLADTASVTVMAAPPVLASIVLTPAVVTLATGGTQQFAVSGVLSSGQTTPVAATFSATGGTISSTGAFTAGSAAGTFRVIATHTPSGGAPLADTTTVTVTSAPPVLASIVLTPDVVTLATAGTQQFSVSGVLSNGQSTAVTATYTATGGTISASGLYTAGSVAGSFRVIATHTPSGGTPLADTTAVTITTTPPPPPPPQGTSIPLVVQRLAAGTGSVLVSSGIPLVPGRMTAAQISQFRVFVNGVEQAIYAEALAGTHKDGSLRTVLVQFNYVLNGTTPVTGQLFWGQARQTTDLAKPTASRSTPLAVVLPSDPVYLVSTDLNGPTTTSSAVRALGGIFTRYEDEFAQYADYHWTRGGSAWAENYYDRALIYYGFWVKTGRVEYWRRATELAFVYRRDFLEANNYNSQPHWIQLEGLEQHYLLTGDEASRTAIGRAANNMHAWRDYIVNDLWESRIQARVLHSFLLAWRLNAQGPTIRNWSVVLDETLTSVLGTQSADGSYHMPDACNVQMNYMVGLLNDVYIKYHTYYKADARIVTSVRKSVDYLWTTQWMPANRAFKYVSGGCGGTGTADEPAPDLNGLFLTSFGWTAKMSGVTTYRDRGDLILGGMIDLAALDGSKQFNESFTSSYRYTAYR